MSLPTPAKRRQFEHHQQVRVRRHEEKNATDKEEEEEQEEEEDEDEEEEPRIRTIDSKRATSSHMAAGGNSDSFSSVNAKIGLFERLSSADEALLRRHQQQQRQRDLFEEQYDELYDANNVHDAMYDQEEEHVLDNEDDDGQLEDGDYLVLDTIVEEDELESESQQTTTTTTTGDLPVASASNRLLAARDKLVNCDEVTPATCSSSSSSSASASVGHHRKLVRQPAELSNASSTNADEEAPGEASSGAAAARSDQTLNATASGNSGGATATSQDKNNNHNNANQANCEQPPAESTGGGGAAADDEKENNNNNNNKVSDRRSVESLQHQQQQQQQQQQVGVMAELYGNFNSSNRNSNIDEHEREQQSLRQLEINDSSKLSQATEASSEKKEFDQTTATTTSRAAFIVCHENSPNSITTTATTGSFDGSADFFKMTATTTTTKQANNNNKMQQQYQTLLPSTNRLISEHQARQQQALFRALNERQKILDELGPDERLKQADLMSSASSCLQLHATKSARQWRRSRKQQQQQKSGKTSGSLGRRRSSSMNTLQPAQPTSAQTSNRHHQRHQRPSSDASRGVPLSAVDLSSMTDQQVDELLGQLAPASSSSSLASSGSSGGSHAASLLNGRAGNDSASSSSSCSAADSDLSMTSCSSSSSSEEEDDYDEDLRDSSRRLRRERFSSSSSTAAAAAGAENQQHLEQREQVIHLTTSQQRRQRVQVMAPSVVGVHEDGGSPPSGRQGAAAQKSSSSSRKCREAYKKQRQNRHGGRSDDDDDEHGGRDRRNPGDLLVSVGGGGGGAPSGDCTSNISDTQPISGLATTTSGHDAASLSPQAHQSNSITKQQQQQQQQHHSLGSTSTALSGTASSPTTSDEPADCSLGSLAHLRQPVDDTCGANAATGASGHSVEAILSRMLGALDEVGAQEEQEQLNELLERGFLHLEQLLECNLTPSQQQQQQQTSLPRSQQNQHLNPQKPSSHNSQAQLISHSSSNTVTSSNSQKDSDYGSDTQSNGECFSTSTSQTNSTSNEHQVTTLTSTPTSVTRGNQTSAAPLGTPNVAYALSPLAIELSFKLAESLRRLASQQQATRQLKAEQAPPPQQQEQQPLQHVQPEAMSTSAKDARESQVAPTACAAPAAKARMKSVVMINSPSACSSASPSSSRPQSSRSQAPIDFCAYDGALETEETCLVRQLEGCGNMTPPPPPPAQTAVASPRPSSTASRRDFRTRVSLNTTQAAAAAAATAVPGAKLDDATQIVKVTSSAAVATSPFERQSRRSSFRNSSLRRRPSFSGSIASIREPGVPRPGSPVPRSVLELQQQHQHQQQVVILGSPLTTTSTSSNNTCNNFKSSSQQIQVNAAAGESKNSTTTTTTRKQQVAAAASGQMQDATAAAAATSANIKQQRQLQRALVLAQKYNYSPAKLAASKLGSKLQLGNFDLQQATDAGCFAAQDSSLKQNSEVQTTTEAAATNLSLRDSAAIVKHQTQAGHKWSRQVPVTSNHLQQQQQQPPFAVTGRVQLDISYFAKSGSLTVHLLQCAQLAAVSKRRTTSNPYVKLYLLPDRSKTGKRKSSVKRHQLEPKFDERFTFGPLQLADFDSRILWLSVWHKDRGLSRNEFLGELFLPMSKVRHQLLTSDLSCQSTSSKWYELSDRCDRIADSLDNQQQQQPRGASDNNLGLLTTKRVPQSNGHLSMSLAAARPTSGTGGAGVKSMPRVQQQQAAELVAKKLSEFERKAARLTQQSQQLLAAPPPGAESRLLKTLERHHKGAAPVRPLSNAPLLDAPVHTSQVVHKTMQVTLGPPPSSDQQQGGATATISSSSSASASAWPVITGQLFVALKFVPESAGGELLARRASASLEGNLHVLIKEARNIGGFLPTSATAGRKLSSDNNAGEQQQHGTSTPNVSSNHGTSQQLPSPFCKCYLLDCNGQRLAKQRTSQLKRTSSPRWDQELVFSSQKLSNLQAQAVEIQLFNRDSILVSSSEHLGAIRLCRRLKEPAASPEDIADHQQQQQQQQRVGQDSLSTGSSSYHPAPGANEQVQAEKSSSASLRSSASSKSSSGNSMASGAQLAIDDDLCSERESRLWSQMLARPNIWVYGELPLRQLRPLVALPQKQQQQIAAATDLCPQSLH